MGEAKRRKQVLGQEYGKVPSVLKEGTPQAEKHLNDFFVAWSNEWDRVFSQDSDIGEENFFPQAREVLRDWLREYLTPYRPEDQEKLVMALLEIQYQELLEIEENISKQQPSELTEAIWDWLLISLTCFGVIKEHLTPKNAVAFTQILQDFYLNLPLDDSDENVDYIRQLFHDCLGEYFLPEENQ